MGEVFKNKSALQELFNFARIEGNANDIEYNLKELFESTENPSFKIQSAIVSEFKSKGEFLRTSENISNVDELISFIKGNNIGLLAPYMAQNFNFDEVDELTVSWWTQEIEDENQLNDPDGEGQTPAIKLSLGDLKKNRISNFSRLQSLLVGDDYAMENPTVVFGRFEEPTLVDPEGGVGPIIGGGTGGSGTTTESKYPHELGLNCVSVQSSDIVRWQMENFKLTGNTRDWPHPNRISIWVNSITNKSSETPYLNEKKFPRSDVDKWLTDFIPNNGLLATSWEEVNYNQNIVMAYKKPFAEVDETAVVFSAKRTSSGAFETTASANITYDENAYKTFVNQGWLRCGELNGNYRVSVGNGLQGGVAVYSYDLDRKGYKAQFTVAPKVIRF